MVRRNELGRRKPYGGTGTVILLILFFASLPLLAARRRGATVEVRLTDGGRVRGELLAVKPDALLVYDPVAGQGKTIDLKSAVWVKVLRKSRPLLGLAIGVSAGLVVRLFDTEGQVHHNASMKPVLVTALIGVALGTLAGNPQTFSRKGTSFLDAQDLDWLREHAREK